MATATHYLYHEELSAYDEAVKKERYAMWEKLRRAVAWLIRAAHMLVRLLTRPPASPASLVKLEEKTSYLSLSELEEAERRIVKNVQNQAFPEELSRPDGSKGLLAKLKPL